MRRLGPVLAFAGVATLIVVGLHVYLIRGLVLEPNWPEPWRSGLCALIAGLGAMLILQPFAERWAHPRVARFCVWPASLWMGFAWLLVCALAASDLALWTAGGVAQAAGQDAAALGASPYQAIGVVALAGCAGLFAVHRALRSPQVRRVRVELERWPRALDGFRIVQISDLHIGAILRRDFAAAVTRQVNALAPDLIAVTGDLVDGSVAKLADEVAPFAELSAPHGVFFVTGNHDHYSGARAWVARVGQLGMRVLRNERVRIGDPADSFDLIGVDDYRGDAFGGSGSQEDLPRALAGRDSERPAVLLAHDPNTFKRAAESGVDLQLSGHTHGGQIWPFGYLVKLAVPCLAGLLSRGKSQLYVSSGTGFWGPPMRLGTAAEITELELRAAAQS